MIQINLRPELARHLRQRLNAFGDGFRRNLALIGPVGSGKTFQLRLLLERPSAKLQPIYCALYRESCASFLNRLRCAILQAATESPSGHGLLELFDEADQTAPKTSAALRAVETLLTRRFYGEAFTRILDAIPILSEERGRNCVLVLDEFLLLEELGLSHAFHELGKRVMTWPSTLFIFTSSSPYRARTILRERLQLLFGQFELLTLDALEPRTALSWIQQELRGLQGTKALRPFLIRWLGCYPWYVSGFLKRLKELAALRRTKDVNETLFFQAAWDLLGSPEGMLHQWCLARIEKLSHERYGKRATEALIEIANNARTATEIGRRVGRASLSSALQCLVEHDVVQRKGACWLIADPILQCWLASILAPQRSGATFEEAAMRRGFEAHLTQIWERWVSERQLSLTDRVTQWFRNFRDETVSLNTKTGRLPRFHTITKQQVDASRRGTYLVAEGSGKRWLCAVADTTVDESAIAHFEAFCHVQLPRASRKVVVASAGCDQNARLLAKAHSIWVWEGEDIGVLLELYGNRREHGATLGTVA